MTDDDHIDCDNELNEAEDKIIQLQAELADEKATVKHLRKKAEFDMPPEMHGRFHNGQCPDACDTIDGPCACGATHNAKEWISKLQDKLNKHRWIPVGERLPEVKGWYWVYYGRYRPPSTHCQLWDKKWEIGLVLGRQQDIDAITHWKPTSLP